MRWLLVTTLLAGCSLGTGAVAPSTDSAVIEGGADDTSPEAGPTDAGPDVDTSVGDDSSAPTDSAVTMDAATDTAMPIDTGTVDTGTVGTGPFGAPVMFYSTSTSIDDPTLTGDLLELYFNSTDDIWRMTRASVGAAWGTPSVVAELSSGDTEGTPEIHPDGLSIWFHSGRTPSMGSNDIWRSDRASRSDAWGAPVYVPSLSTPGADSAPSVTRDSLLAVDDFDPPGESSDMQRHRRATASDAWSMRRDLTALNTPNAETNPAISADGLVIVFDSDRPGGLGAHDIYIATRTSRTDPFGVPLLLTEVSSTGSESDSWISPDYRTLVFVSTRSGMSAFYEARR